MEPEEDEEEEEGALARRRLPEPRAAHVSLALLL